MMCPDMTLIPDCGGPPSASCAVLPEPLALPPGRIDLWVALLDEEADSGLTGHFARISTEEERRQQGKFHFAKDRYRYLVTRLLVRYTLSRYAPTRPEAWQFAANDFGRPFIANPDPVARGLEFNLSHSQRMVILGVARDCRIGVDVEDLPRRAPLDIADRFFSPSEVRQLQSLPSAARAGRFFDFWTLKESYVKAHGQGLSLPLDRFGFELAAGHDIRAYFDSGLDDTPENWVFWQWHPTADSVAALCAARRSAMAPTCVRRVVPFGREEAVPFVPVRMSPP